MLSSQSPAISNSRRMIIRSAVSIFRGSRFLKNPVRLSGCCSLGVPGGCMGLFCPRLRGHASGFGGGQGGGSLGGQGTGVGRGAGRFGFSCCGSGVGFRRYDPSGCGIYRLYIAHLPPVSEKPEFPKKADARLAILAARIAFSSFAIRSRLK